MPPHQHDRPTHKCLFHSLIFGHAREYSETTCALAPLFPTPTSSNTNSARSILYSPSDGFLSFFLEDYELDQDLKLSFDFFVLAFQHMPHLSANGLFKMVFEHL